MEIILLLALLFAAKQKKPTSFISEEEIKEENKILSENEIKAILAKLKPPTGYPIVFRTYSEIPGQIQATINDKLYKIKYVINGTELQSAVARDIILWLNYWWTLPADKLVKDTGEMFKLMQSQPQVFNNAKDLVNLIRNIYGLSPAYAATNYYTPVDWTKYITITDLNRDPILNNGSGGTGTLDYSDYKQSQSVSGNSCMA